MSHSAAAAHGHDDHAADHGSLKSYIIGFVLSLLLTFGSFGLVMNGGLSHTITIIGVVGDSRFRTVRTPIDPIMFMNVKRNPAWMMIRYRGDPATIEAAVERQWKQITNEVPFQAKFSEDIIAEVYEAEDARAQIFAAFAVLAVIIGCLGLFGLAAFTAERRTKEIGIRKVLGARTRDIVRLLVWQFSRPVIVANLIAWPVAWWLMRDWLNTFDQRITLGPAPFVLAALAALTIAVVTVVGHAMKVARANPSAKNAALRSSMIDQVRSAFVSAAVTASGEEREPGHTTT